MPLDFHDLYNRKIHHFFLCFFMTGKFCLDLYWTNRNPGTMGSTKRHWPKRRDQYFCTCMEIAEIERVRTESSCTNFFRNSIITSSALIIEVSDKEIFFSIHCPWQWPWMAIILFLHWISIVVLTEGYGDSDPADLSENGVVADSKFVLQWLLKKVNGTAPVFVWGHSLGTG